MACGDVDDTVFYSLLTAMMNVCLLYLPRDQRQSS